MSSSGRRIPPAAAGAYDVPAEVTDAYQRLRDAGFTGRLMY
jgi:hypothetical protein